MWRLRGKGRWYGGRYERDKKGERIFVLTQITGDWLSKKGPHRVVFESWQSAKNNGWVKL